MKVDTSKTMNLQFKMMFNNVYSKLKMDFNLTKFKYFLLIKEVRFVLLGLYQEDITPRSDI